MTAQVAKRPRPFFLSESIDFDVLPEAVQVAFETIILPVYEELVLAPASGLERAAGETIVFLLTKELLDQFELAQTFNLTLTAPLPDRETGDKAFQRHLKLVNAKQTAISALSRVRKMSRELCGGP